MASNEMPIGPILAEAMRIAAAAAAARVWRCTLEPMSGIRYFPRDEGTGQLLAVQSADVTDVFDLEPLQWEDAHAPRK